MMAAGGYMARNAGHSARRRARARRGGLFLLALFLAASGLLRIGDGIGQAFAEGAPAQEAASPPTPAACEPDGGAADLLASLRARATRLGEQERKAADREQALRLAREEIDAKLAELAAAEEKLAATVAVADQAADKDVARLVAMYEAMKPKDAAKLFGEMDPDFAAGFLARMRPEAAAAILAGLEPERAYTISAVLAGRNAKAPKS